MSSKSALNRATLSEGLGLKFGEGTPLCLFPVENGEKCLHFPGFHFQWSLGFRIFNLAFRV